MKISISTKTENKKFDFYKESLLSKFCIENLEGDRMDSNRQD